VSGRHARGPRRLAQPRLARVRADPGGRPEAVGGRPVEAVRESWLVEDRWWTDRPLRRRYWEVVTADGRDLVVFRDLEGGRWYAQR
jgi:CO dehydrogenase/acetyl-CoA synthase delta subunit